MSLLTRYFEIMGGEDGRGPELCAIAATALSLTATMILAPMVGAHFLRTNPDYGSAAFLGMCGLWGFSAGFIALAGVSTCFLHSCMELHGAKLTAAALGIVGGIGGYFALISLASSPVTDNVENALVGMGVLAACVLALDFASRVPNPVPCIKYALTPCCSRGDAAVSAGRTPLLP